MTRLFQRAYWLPPFILQSIAWIPVWFLFKVFCRFEIVGFHNLKSLSQAIFAVNHSSELDPIILTAALPLFSRFSPMFYVAAPSQSFNKKSFGWRRHLYAAEWFFRVWGAYSTVPGHKNYAVSLQNHIAILKDGKSVCIFPEGGISKSGELKEAKGGVAFLSHITDIPVVPVAIIGSFQTNFFRFLNPRRKIKVVFGKPTHAKEHWDVPDPQVEHFHHAAKHFMSKVSEYFIK